MPAIVLAVALFLLTSTAFAAPHAGQLPDDDAALSELKSEAILNAPPEEEQDTSARPGEERETPPPQEYAALEAGIRANE